MQNFYACLSRALTAFLVTTTRKLLVLSTLAESPDVAVVPAFGSENTSQRRGDFGLEALPQAAVLHWTSMRLEAAIDPTFRLLRLRLAGTSHAMSPKALTLSYYPK